MITAPLLLLVLLAGQGSQPAQPTSAGKPHTAAASTTVVEIEAMRRDIQALTAQIAGLRASLADRPKFDVTTFNANVARLQLVNQELDRLRKLRDDVKAKLRTAQGNEDDARYRLSNVQAELIYAAGLDRQANEDRIRRELERDLDAAQSAESEATEQLSNLDLQISQTEQVAEKLRRRLKIDYTQVDAPDEEPNSPPSPEPAPRDDGAADTNPNE